MAAFQNSGSQITNAAIVNIWATYPVLVLLKFFSVSRRFVPENTLAMI